jgi:endonuclease/exonuclease/phosphatase family metal-dependent hydrolase
VILKRFILIFALIFSFIAAAALPLRVQAATTKIEVAVISNVRRDANVRAKPTVESTLLGTAKKDTKYTILGREGEFYKIFYNGATAYVHSDYVNTKSYPALLNDSVNIRVATFNVHAFGNGNKLSDIAEAIRESGAQVVGLQEVDRFVPRSGKLDYAKELSLATGYPYYYFSKAINLNGGEYGTMILSQQPIIFAETYTITTAGEDRVMGYTQLLTNKGLVNFFNVHMPNGSSSQKISALRAMEKKISSTGAKHYIVTGDFNASAEWLGKNIKLEAKLANTKLKTFGRGSSTKIIDNIICSENILASSLGSLETLNDKVSDHNLISVRVRIPKG